ncbi:hypothetical protein LSP03_29840 [Lysinibacillus sphaericus]|nr:hypothetical protein LSP03_29840 [Lysinibacillus sphaericus]
MKRYYRYFEVSKYPVKDIDSLYKRFISNGGLLRGFLERQKDEGLISIRLVTKS